jgi:hypothetical protein
VRRTQGRRTRHAALATVAAAVLLGPACGTKPSAELAARASAAESEQAATSAEDGPGVTAEEVKVGFVLLQTEKLQKTLGFTLAPQGDLTRQIDELAKEVNRTGGIGGRKMVPVLRPFEALTDSQATEEKLCKAFTQDDQVFAVVLVFLFALVNGISLGVSDSNPISSAFVVTVVLMAALGLEDPIVGLMAGTVLLVSTSVACDMQQDRSTGWRLGTNRVLQFRYQVVDHLVRRVAALVDGPPPGNRLANRLQPQQLPHDHWLNMWVGVVSGIAELPIRLGPASRDQARQLVEEFLVRAGLRPGA